MSYKIVKTTKKEVKKQKQQSTIPLGCESYKDFEKKIFKEMC